jgi:hypothetical protein
VSYKSSFKGNTVHALRSRTLAREQGLVFYQHVCSAKIVNPPTTLHRSALCQVAKPDGSES